MLYDPKRISEHPGKSDDQNSSTTEDQPWSKEANPPGEKQTDGSFLDKSFQIRFEVPPPNLSDWRSYLLELLDEAFVSSIVGPIIRSRDETDLRWRIRVFSEKPSLTKDQAKPQGWSNLKTMIREAPVSRP